MKSGNKGFCNCNFEHAKMIFLMILTKTYLEVDFVLSTEFQKGFAIECKFDQNSFSRTKYKKFEETYPNFPLLLKSYKSADNETSLLSL